MLADYLLALLLLGAYAAAGLAVVIVPVYGYFLVQERRARRSPDRAVRAA